MCNQNFVCTAKSRATSSEKGLTEQIRPFCKKHYYEKNYFLKVSTP